MTRTENRIPSENWNYMNTDLCCSIVITISVKNTSMDLRHPWSIKFCLWEYVLA